MSAIVPYIKNSSAIVKKQLAEFAGGVFNALGIGGGSSQALPAVADSARSVSVGLVTEVLCSGGNYGIEGFPAPTDGYGGVAQNENYIYLDETPLSAGYLGGSRQSFQWNFPLQSLAVKLGSPGDSGWGQHYELEESQAVNANLLYNSPITRSFVFQADSTATIAFQFSLVLQHANLDGNGNVIQIVGNSATIRIEIQQGSGAWSVNYQFPGGKFSSPFNIVYGYGIDLNNTTFNLRVTLVTQNLAPPYGSMPINDTITIQWLSYTIQVGDPLALKRLAACQLNFDCEQFGTTFPDRRYFINGMYQDIPNNATVNLTDGGLDYTGAYTGGITSHANSTHDTFCHIWYLLTDQIDGLGYYISPSVIDRYSLQAISAYNNTYVSILSTGTTERRFLQQMYIQKASDGWQVIDNLLSACNARRFWQNGILTFTQDRPELIFAVVSNSDITGDFEYSSTDIYQRTNSVVVTWTDAVNYGKTRQEYVSDPTYINKYGLNEKQVEAVGCFRRTQAIRYARSIIYSENMETSVVTFKGRSYIGSIPIGSVILVNDFKTMGNRLGGIVQSSYPQSVYIDTPVEIPILTGYDETFYLYNNMDVWNAVFYAEAPNNFVNGFQHYLAFGISEGRFPIGCILFVNTSTGVEWRLVTNSPGTYTTITVSAAFTTAPQYGDSWALLIPTMNGQTFRVLSKEPDENNIDIFTITATQYTESKYKKIEQQSEAYPLPSETATIPGVGQISNLAVTQSQSQGTNVITATWTPPSSVPGLHYEVGLQKSGVWITSTVWGNSTSWENLGYGNYLIRVLALNYASNNGGYVYSSAVAVQNDPYFGEVALLCPFSDLGTTSRTYIEVTKRSVVSAPQSPPPIAATYQLFGQNTVNISTITSSGTTTYNVLTAYDPNYYGTGGSGAGGILSINYNSYTIEFWVYVTSAPPSTNWVIIDRCGQGTYGGGSASIPNYSIQLTPGLNISFSVGRVATAPTSPNINFGIVSSGSITLNTWSHIACVYSTYRTLSIYINGVREATGTTTFDPYDEPGVLQIGYQQNQPLSYSFIGYLSNLRLTQNVARYTGTSFSPPIQPFPTFATF